MKLLIVLVALFFAHVLSQHQRNDRCRTPGKNDGKCIPLSSCEIIFPIIEQARLRNATALKLARDYQCGHDTEILVCCDIQKDEIYTKSPKPPTKVRKPIILSGFNSTELPDRTICGESQPEDDRIWGGVQTDLGEFPWVAALEYVRKDNNSNAGVNCGGSLINNRFVITAAHCIQHSEFKVVKVRLGEWNLKENPDCYDEDLPNRECADPVQIFGVEKEIPHEFFDRRFSRNDIGLLKLDKDVTYTTYIRPICLPPPDLPLAELGTYMTVVGWGLTEYGTTSDIKLKVDVPLISNGECREKLPSKAISRNNYCAGGELNKDACKGDSGGPLMRSFQNNGPEQWFLEGIVGSGISCGRQDTPALYIRVTQYTNWVIAKLVEDKAKTQNGNQEYKIKPASINFNA